MKDKVLNILVSLLLISTTCLGQSSFQGLTPGASTRDQVNRVLGQPVNTDSTIIAEHTPPAGIQKVEVMYSRDSNVVNQIYIYLAKPISRQALIKSLSLPQQADFKKTGENGFLHEFFGGQALLLLIYESAAADSGVKLMVYNNKESFERVMKRFRGEVDVPLLNGNVTSLRFFPGQGASVPIEKRLYQSRFSSSQSTYIGAELNIEFPPPGREITFDLDAVYYNSNGSVLAKYSLGNPNRVQADWGAYRHDWSTGWTEPGKWPIGTYRVELFINGQKVAAGSFEVY